jgi:hypothetical protein
MELPERGRKGSYLGRWRESYTFRGMEGDQRVLGKTEKELDMGRTGRATWEGWRVNKEKVVGTKRDLFGKDREKAI